MKLTAVALNSLLFLLCPYLCNTLDGDKDDKICLLEDDRFNFENCEMDLANQYYCTPGDAQQSWFKTLYDEALLDQSNTKRRREIRMLSDSERQRYFDAVNALKNDKTIYPNKYDALALAHTNLTVCAVHQGANFLGWHRVYLLIFETALRQKDKSVVLPYWNSIVDNNDVVGPQNTHIFTDAFLGNGYNDVTTGPFGHWVDFRGCPLTRDIGGRNTTLLSPDVVNMIMYNSSILNTSDVVDGGPSKLLDTIEGQHNIGHEWVGGPMGFLNVSVNDPVFFLHHAFIDYIWEKFREKQRRNGIDPETDYHDVARVERGDSIYDLRPYHKPNRTMDCFSWLRNIDGYWNNFTDLYEYEDSPECPDCGNSTLLACNKTLGRCIVSLREVESSAVGLPVEELVGAVLGSIAGLILIIVLGIFLWRFRNITNESETTGGCSGVSIKYCDNKAQEVESESN